MNDQEGREMSDHGRCPWYSIAWHWNTRDVGVSSKVEGNKRTREGHSAFVIDIPSKDPTQDATCCEADGDPLHHLARCTFYFLDVPILRAHERSKRCTIWIKNLTSRDL